MLWPYVTPGIPDDLFERLPGIPMSKREVRLLLISHLRLQADSVVWDINRFAVSQRSNYRHRKGRRCRKLDSQKLRSLRAQQRRSH